MPCLITYYIASVKICNRNALFVNLITNLQRKRFLFAQTLQTLGDQMQVPGGGVLLYMRYIGMCRPKGYGF